MNIYTPSREALPLVSITTRPANIEGKSFPDQPAQGSNPPATIANVNHMLTKNRIVARYNVMKMQTEIVVPWLQGTAENADSVAMTHIVSLASRYGMPTGLVPSMVEAIGNENAYNPAADWMMSKPWDGTDRLIALADTLTARDGYPQDLKRLLVRKWVLSIAAAALLPEGFRCRGVLTLQGPQGMGKTSWGLSLIDDPILRKSLIKVDHHLDAGNKDSLLGAIGHLIVEIGELESSLRRDISRLKGFLTSGSDKVRKPYARVATESQRHTVFYATVNANDFLVDSTGNSRFWTIPLLGINYNHGIDMQQVFAQCATLLKADEVWWLTSAEEVLLEQQNAAHRSFSLVRDRLSDIIDVEATGGFQARTASEVLQAAGFEHPTNAQAKECASYLREWFGEPKRINGRDKWRVPIRAGVQVETVVDDTPRKSKFD